MDRAGQRRKTGRSFLSLSYSFLCEGNVWGGVRRPEASLQLCHPGLSDSSGFPILAAWGCWGRDGSGCALDAQLCRARQLLGAGNAAQGVGWKFVGAEITEQFSQNSLSNSEWFFPQKFNFKSPSPHYYLITKY